MSKQVLIEWTCKERKQWNAAVVSTRMAVGERKYYISI
jgi:hypothetical protein